MLQTHETPHFTGIHDETFDTIPPPPPPPPSLPAPPAAATGEVPLRFQALPGLVQLRFVSIERIIPGDKTDATVDDFWLGIAIGADAWEVWVWVWVWVWVRVSALPY